MAGGPDGDGLHREGPGPTRRSTLARLFLAGLVLGPVLATAADQATPGAPPAARPATHESPYTRNAREHARSTEKAPVKVKPSSFSVGHAARVSARPRP